MAEKTNYSKSSWLRRDTEHLLAEARAKYCLANKDKKATDNNVIKEALKAYIGGKK
jgi:hypothetical protein